MPAKLARFKKRTLTILLLCASGAIAQTRLPNPKTKLPKTAIKKTTVAKTAPPAPPAPPVQVTSEVLAEINAARRNPQSYLPYLEEWQKNFHNNDLRLSGDRILTTVEGAAAVTEAIEFLRTAKPVGELREASGLDKAAAAHLHDIEKTGNTGNIGSDGSKPDQRVARFGKFLGNLAQIVVQGNLTAREIVLTLLVSDGDVARQKRNRIFDFEFSAAGAASAANDKLGNLNVLIFTGGFIEKK